DEGGIRLVDAALTLQRFEQDGCSLVGHRVLERCGVVVINECHWRARRHERLPVLRLPGKRKCTHRTARETLLRGNEVIATRRCPGPLECGLVHFRAGTGHESPPEWRLHETEKLLQE